MICLFQVEARLAEEAERARHFLDASTETRITKVRRRKRRRRKGSVEWKCGGDDWVREGLSNHFISRWWRMSSSSTTWSPLFR